MKIDVRENNEAVAREVISVALDAGRPPSGVPARVLVAPWGEVRSRNAAFVLDEEAARMTVAAFNAHATDLPIDYEHQSLGGPYSSPTGQAPAAGWIKSLAVIAPHSEDGTPPGLWAEVEWTPPAREQLAAKQYRYLSPVALVRCSDRRMIGLHSAALTNKPAIVGMRPVVNSDEGWGALRAALDADESIDEVALVAGAAERLRTLRTLIDVRNAHDRVEAALTEGKLTAAQREWAYGLALRDPQEFDDWLAHAPVVVQSGRIAPPKTVGDASSETVIRQARREFREGGRLLAAICSEEAFVNDALRRAGLAVVTAAK